jgi:glycosyltransferase involved in cell wall biosynthesis
MIRKYFGNIVPGFSSPEFENLLDQVEAIRNNSEVIALYGSPTQGNWLGIANATKGVFPNNNLSIPQHYSHCRLKNKQIDQLIEKIIKHQFEKVIFSGFAPYFLPWIEKLTAHLSVEILYHGTISEWHDSSHREFIGTLIKYGENGIIKRFGFVKKGLEVIFSNLYGFESYHQPLSITLIPQNLKKLDLDRSKIHIGVFGADTFNKNLHNQVIHALMIENAMVHVLDKSVFEYLNLSNRIVEHGKNLPREVFLSILGSMDLNLYMSFNESWGLVAYESEAMGVPCISQSDIDYLQLINAKLKK